MTAPQSAFLPALPTQPEGVPWPTDEWPEAPLGGHVAKSRLQELMDHAFSDPAAGRIWERPMPFWRFRAANLFTSAIGPISPRITRTLPGRRPNPSRKRLWGILVGQGKIDIHAPANVPEWQDQDGPRRQITLDQLLRMSSGLKFTEDYVDGEVSDVIEMLFGSGQD